MSDGEPLKPCPFCGGDAEMDTRQAYVALGSGRLGSAIAIYCTACTASVSTCREDVPDITPEEMTDQWNRRAA
jgi:hypothetical protein